jgi:hypothetical protein
MIKIEFGYTDSVIAKHTPIKPMSECLPDWYKNLSKYPDWASKCPIKRLLNKQHATIKACPPVFDYLTSGYMMPWIYESYFKREKDENGIAYMKYYSSYEPYLGNFESYQFPKLKTCFFKVNQPWSIKTPKGYSCLYFQPFYNFEERYSILPAVVDTDKFHNISIVGYMLQDDFKIKPNEPLVCVLPFKRDEFKHELKQYEKDQSGKSVIGESYMNFGVVTSAEHKLYLHNSYRLLSWVKKIFR